MEMLDGMKDLGFLFATTSGSTIAISDEVVPEEKNLRRLLLEVDERVPVGFRITTERDY